MVTKGEGEERDKLEHIHTQFSSVAQSCLTLQPHGLQHARPPCPSPTFRACSNSCPSSQWCHPTISSSVIPFSPCLQSFPTSGSFPRSQFFTAGGQIIGVSASTSVLPMNIQDWSPLGWTGWISLQSMGLSRLALSSLYSPTLTSIHDHWKNSFCCDGKWDCFLNFSFSSFVVSV